MEEQESFYLLSKDQIYRELISYFLDHNESYIRRIIDQLYETNIIPIDISIGAWTEYIRDFTYNTIKNIIHKDTQLAYQRLHITYLLQDQELSFDIISLIAEKI